MADLCTIDRAGVADHGELLTLQRAAFVDEARLYATPEVPALAETFDELDARLRRSITLAARVRGRIVGAVSLRTDVAPPAIERLMVAPDQRGAGLATRLMVEIEAVARRDRYREVRLDVGEIAEENRRLYERLGYRYVERKLVFATVGVWTMAKDLDAT